MTRLMRRRVKPQYLWLNPSSHLMAIPGTPITMSAEFLSIFILLLFSIILSTVISGASYIVGVKQPDSEKVSVYECGFDPFESSRIPFSVRFFLVGILFMIFDLEISFSFSLVCGL